MVAFFQGGFCSYHIEVLESENNLGLIQGGWEGRTSLIPRPHPFVRRNGVVNQVEFLGLVHTFATVSPSNVHAKPAQKGMAYLNRNKRFYCCKGSAM